MTQLDSRWYAVQVRPKCERFVAEMLEAKGYDRFLPLYVQRRRWSDRMKVLELPLIPNYVFCRMTDDTVGRVVTTPNVIRIVGAGRTPIAVDAWEIEALQRIDALRLRAEPWPFFRAGDVVMIEEGPLTGVHGVVLRSKSGNRLIVSVSLLQRSVAVDIDAASVSSRTGSLVA